MLIIGMVSASKTTGI